MEWVTEIVPLRVLYADNVGSSIPTYYGMS